MRPQEPSKVVTAAGGVPVLISGGSLVTELEALRVAEQAIAAGAAGVSFGRNVFSRSSSQTFLRALGAVVHSGYSAEPYAASAVSQHINDI